MKRRIPQLLILIAFLVVIGASWKTLQESNEPSYDGKLLSQWLDDRVATPAGPIVLTDDAVLAVQQIGPKAIPVLLDWLQRSDLPGFQQLRYGANIAVPLNDTWRNRAIYGFRALGDDASIAIPELVHVALHATDPDVRNAAISSLTNDHPSTTKLLSEGLHNDDAELRFRAAHVLGCIRSPAAIELLTSALGDHHPNVRSESARGLGRYSSPLLPDKALHALESRLSDPDPSVCAATRSALNNQHQYRQARLTDSEL